MVPELEEPVVVLVELEEVPLDPRCVPVPPMEPPPIDIPPMPPVMEPSMVELMVTDVLEEPLETV